MTEELAMEKITTGKNLDIWDPDQFDHLARMSKAFSKSTLVPKHFQDKPEDCMIGLQLAKRMDADPFAVLQNISVIHGRPCFSAAFAIALANTSGKFEGPLIFHYDGQGASLACTAVVTLKGGPEIRETVTMEMAKADGWTRNEKYKTLPKLMLRYRAAMFLIRAYAPELLMGMHHSIEEVSALPRQVEGREVSFKKESLPPKEDEEFDVTRLKGIAPDATGDLSSEEFVEQVRHGRPATESTIAKMPPNFPPERT